MGDWLLVVDTPGIKEYIFGTDRLKEIRGASAILDHLNRSSTAVVLAEVLGPDRVETVYANGGSGQFLVSGAEEAVLRDGVMRVARLYREQTAGAASVVAGWAELAAGYPAALARAHADLAVAKAETLFGPTPGLHAGHLDDCRACYRAPADGPSPDQRDDREICSVCRQKLLASRKRRVWREFATSLNEAEGGSARPWDLQPADFDEIASACARPGYGAVVYADGNAMGRVIKTLKSHVDFRRFSEAIDAAVRRACFAALRECCPRSAGSAIPADILLLGGDDLVVYLPADRALPFACRVAEIFTQETCRELSGLQGLEPGATLSFGVAIGKTGTPFRVLLDQAEELLALSKKRGSAGSEPAQTCIDFHLSSHFGPVAVQDVRATCYRAPRSSGRPDEIWTRRPYRLADMNSLLAHARRISATVPSGRLHRLAEAVRLGGSRTTIEVIHEFTRAKGPAKDALHQYFSDTGCLADLPWCSIAGADGPARETGLIDLAEVVSLMPKGVRDARD